MLHNAARYARPDEPVSAALQELQMELTPLYVTVMPAASKEKAAKKAASEEKGQGAGQKQSSPKIFPGPLAQLPQRCQV